MSKSKKNVVDPNDIIEGYGADVARWFVLSDSPPERDVEWTEAGVIGAWRFADKVWRLVADVENKDNAKLFDFSNLTGECAKMHWFANRGLQKITDGIENFRFNTSVAQIYNITNTCLLYTSPSPRDRG